MQGRLQYASAQIEQASVVLGSATPSVEAFSWCQGGSCTMLELKNRATRQVTAKGIHGRYAGRIKEWKPQYFK